MEVMLLEEALEEELEEELLPEDVPALAVGLEEERYLEPT